MAELGNILRILGIVMALYLGYLIFFSGAVFENFALLFGVLVATPVLILVGALLTKL